MGIRDVEAAVHTALDKLKTRFVPAMRVTFIARLPGDDEADLMIGDDDPQEVARLVRRRMDAEAAHGDALAKMPVAAAPAETNDVRAENINRLIKRGQELVQQAAAVLPPVSPAGEAAVEELAREYWDKQPVTVIRPAASSDGQAEAKALLEAAHAFFRARRKAGQDGAVQWLTGIHGELVIFTRSEFRSKLMENINNLTDTYTFGTSESLGAAP